MPDFFSNSFLKYFIASGIILFLFRPLTENKSLVTIDGDAKGYYAYLPALIIHHSFDWKKLDGVKPGYSNDFLVNHQQKHLNKYSIGSALLLTPFFLLSALLSYILGYPVDGFSGPFQYGVLAASVFYLMLGLYFTINFLKIVGINNKAILISVLLFLFGSNLFYYAIYEPGMSHVYAFYCISSFIFFLKKYFNSTKQSHFNIAAASLALAVLIRPTHILLIILIPFLSESANNLKTGLRINKTAKGIILFVLFVLLLPVCWYLQTGNYFIQPYKNEGFYFTHPEIFNFLFGFRKGLFIYTPLLFVSLFGLVYLYKQNKYQALLLSSYIIVLIYILSSWWNWYYGDGFGQRALIDYYLLFTYLLSLLLHNSNKTANVTAITISIICVMLNLVQTYQYHTHIIHPDAMNWQKYKAVFLKTDEKYQFALNGAPELFYTPTGYTVLKNYKLWITSENKEAENAASIYLSKKNEYGLILKIKVNALNLSGKRLYVHTNLSYDKPFAEIPNEIYFVVNISDSAGNSYFWKNEKLFSLEKTTGNNLQEFGFRLPEIKSSNDELSIYIWNKEKKEFSVNDVKVEFREANVK